MRESTDVPERNQPGRELAAPYLDCHVELLLVWGQVVALGQEHLPEGSFAQLPLQNDVVPLDVLNNWKVCVEKQESEVNCLLLLMLST